MADFDPLRTLAWRAMLCLMKCGPVCRSVAAALMSLALLTSCEQRKAEVRAVSLKEYGDVPRCWFREGEDLEALLVVADEDDGSESVPWLISSKCIAKGDMPSYGSATLYLLGPPYVVDPRGLLRKHVTSKMRADNVRTHLPLPSGDSPVYYIVARLKPVPDRPHYEITAVKRVAATEVRFLELLEMGPTERSELVARVS